jgi:hypothetical protein
MVKFVLSAAGMANSAPVTRHNRHRRVCMEFTYTLAQLPSEKKHFVNQKRGIAFSMVHESILTPTQGKKHQSLLKIHYA